jgi:hypothetical protein
MVAGLGQESVLGWDRRTLKLSLDLHPERRPPAWRVGALPFG